MVSHYLQGAGSPSKARAAAAVGPQPRWGKRAAARPRLSDVDWEAQVSAPAGLLSTCGAGQIMWWGLITAVNPCDKTLLCWSQAELGHLEAF